MRVALHDGYFPDWDRSKWSQPVVLDDDPWVQSTFVGDDDQVDWEPIDQPPATGLPVVEIRERSRTGYDAEGVPEYGWATVASAVPVVMSQVRTQVNDASGLTQVVGKFALGWPDDGTPAPRETAVLVDAANRRWSITMATPLAEGGMNITATRIDGEVPSYGVGD